MSNPELPAVSAFVIRTGSAYDVWVNGAMKRLAFISATDGVLTFASVESDYPPFEVGSAIICIKEHPIAHPPKSHLTKMFVGYITTVERLTVTPDGTTLLLAEFFEGYYWFNCDHFRLATGFPQTSSVSA